MARRSYSGIAPATSLTTSLASGDLVFTVGSGTGYPTGAAGPFFVLLDRGLPSEEKVLITSRSGTSFTMSAGGRGQDGTVAAAHNAQASVEHTLTALDLDEMNAHTNDVGDPHPQYLTPVEGNAAYATTLHTHAPTGTTAKTVRVPHTFTISGDVLVAVGDTSYIPPFFIRTPAGQTVTLVEMHHVIRSGTSTAIKLQRAPFQGAAVDVPTGTATVTTIDGYTDMTDLALSQGDKLSLVVTAASGTPKNMSVTIYLDYTV